MRRKRPKGFYKAVAKAIFEGAPFDTKKNNDGGWATVQELICLYMLSELSDADRHKFWASYLTKVKSCFWPAVHYINDNPDDLPEYAGIHVYIWHPEKKRNNEFVSIKVGYRKAKDRNTERLIRKIEQITRVAISEIGQTQPERLKEGKNRTMGLFE